MNTIRVLKNTILIHPNVHTSHTHTSHAGDMAGIQQDDPYYQALVVYGKIEVGLDDNPEENPEGGLAMGQELEPRVEPEEYVVTDYEYDDFDRESDEGKDVKETPSKPRP
ncbi:unnamed protein product [Lactuca saligna]|uniref:Uncharacterized protein n=1 Tax=Lactuca saligna TaxID=75948 RepID=A0AA35ZWY1_LACSI|nr:unnamed protein product [Lactuca saligna]